ncbi:hypothetical protein EWQ15_31435 [Klebsiella pneumoniae]|uniref:hypothetical protein n=1 Tax=Corynebacterium kroppenstedtii TaxID=161879 RepID=UPI0010AB11A7|nr:hypothetical protein [Corynebacterium kroppenstedtii]QRQ65158.1 hypothetical protein I6J23_01290 [Corynebacterium kroppenstedtii]TIH59417.1 hypothetical protein EWQ15_31435 [Klebsiella pneumoniae]
MSDRVEWKFNHQFFNRVLKEDGQTRALVDAKAEEFRGKAGSHCTVLPAIQGKTRWRALVVPTPHDSEAYVYELKHNSMQKAIGEYPVATNHPRSTE